MSVLKRKLYPKQKTTVYLNIQVSLVLTRNVMREIATVATPDYEEDIENEPVKF